MSTYKNKVLHREVGTTTSKIRKFSNQTTALNYWNLLLICYETMMSSKSRVETATLEFENFGKCVNCFLFVVNERNVYAVAPGSANITLPPLKSKGF